MTFALGQARHNHPPLTTPRTIVTMLAHVAGTRSWTRCIRLRPSLQAGATAA